MSRLEHRYEPKRSYFEWLIHIISPECLSDEYLNLLSKLYSVTFTCRIGKDSNRASDGKSLREKFLDENPNIDRECHSLDSFLYEPCSILEMMIALSIRMEVEMMEDPEIGPMPGYWFWKMIESLGLIDQTDSTFDKQYVSGVLYRFLNREYEDNGEGGLFTIQDPNIKTDMKKLEIWSQMCMYLSYYMGLL